VYPARFKLLAVRVGKEQPTPAFLERGAYFLNCQLSLKITF
jgi:hypothetical protein